MPDARPTAVVVLAAGEGTRMRSAIPKVLHELAGVPLLGHVLSAVVGLRADRTLVVVGHGRDQVVAALRANAGHAEAVVQDEQRGTGHAVRLALAGAGSLLGTVLVVPGDAPLLRTETLRALIARQLAEGAAAALLTAVLVDPTGYGRVVRDAAGRVVSVMEQRDASPAQLSITEVATSVYAFDADLLRGALSRLTTDNTPGEEYLTDVIGLFVADGRRVTALTATDAAETAGVNDRIQLAAAGRVLNDRLLGELMRSGVTVVDPATTWVSPGVRVGRDTVLLPGVQLSGATEIGDGARIGPDCTLADTFVGPGAVVVRAHCDGARIGPRASVGPYAYLRPGASIGAGAKVGTYVEVKNADLGEGAKVPHLTYVGDAEIGAGTNIGASSVFVNYDGVHKARTVVGAHARMGSDTMYVAPVTVGDGAYSGAGTVLTDDVPPGALAVRDAKQRIIEGWVAKKRPGTEAALAAERALAGAAGDQPTPDRPTPDRPTPDRPTPDRPAPGWSTPDRPDQPAASDVDEERPAT